MKFNTYVTKTAFSKNQGSDWKQFHDEPEVVKPKPQRTIQSIITDKDGLERAYQSGDYFIHGDTMYVAGSHTAKDWYDDFTKIPVWGDLRNSTRYEAADK